MSRSPGEFALHTLGAVGSQREEAAGDLIRTSATIDEEKQGEAAVGHEEVNG